MSSWKNAGNTGEKSAGNDFPFISGFRFTTSSDVISGDVNSGDVTSGDVTSGDATSGDLISGDDQPHHPPQMLTELSPYTTYGSSRFFTMIRQFDCTKIWMLPKSVENNLK